MKNLISKVFAKRLLERNRRVMSMMAVAVISMSAFAGCGTASNQEVADSGNVEINAASAGSDDAISVVTTIFPEYDWVREITAGNDNVDITMLLDNGVDLHSYQPTADDILKVATADVFIYVGGESDGWVEDALKESMNPDMQVINLLDVLGDEVKEEEIVEGMEHHHDHEHEEGEEHEDHEHEDAEEHEDHEHEDAEAEHESHEEAEHEHNHTDEEVEYDEHVWLSLENTETLVGAIADSLEKADPANADLYAKNVESYEEKLEALDAKYEAAVEAASVHTILFGDRFPFRYMADDYDLDYYAAFVGCSAETEASFETITFLAGKVDELGLKTVLTIENSDQKIAKTIIENTASKDAQILALDSMQATTSDDVAAGATYLNIMEDNLNVLTDALK